jgi:DNA-binding HxlR family transcriptional regulator
MQVTMLGSMQRASLSALVPCPIARSLEILGEWWTLLIVRDAIMGARRFDEFKTTGIADNILTARLKKLTEAGILERRLYQERPPRYEYVLTEKGYALGPVVLALRTWGRQWTDGDDSSIITHSQCGHELSVAPFCEACERAVGPPEVRVAPSRAVH